MSKRNLKILVVDDDQGILKSLSFTLGQVFTYVHTISSTEQIPFLLNRDDFDVVLLDMNFRAGQNTGNEGIYWLREILRQKSETVVIMITAFGTIDLAVKAIKEGASDFITKPWKPGQLLETIGNAITLKAKKSNKGNVTPNLEQDGDTVFLGDSEVIRSLLGNAKKAALSDAAVLITGEHGTGKEVLARQIHGWSTRHSKPFVAVDLGSITPSLFESELFGHEKSAFTGAVESRKGRIEMASGGSLFLDEIGNLQADQQQKLLSVLQRKEVIRVGADKPIPLDVRIITATNEVLPDQVRQGFFRADLFYRINTIHFHIPPLRLRRGDVPIMANYFLVEYAAKYQKETVDISHDAMQKLETYHWPGNVRELQHIIEKAVILHDTDKILPNQISFSEAELSYTPDSLNLEDVEKITIKTALDQFPGNISKAARELGISRKTLYKKIEKYGF